MARAHNRPGSFVPGDDRDHLRAVGAAVISAQQIGVSIAPAIRYALRTPSERWVHFSLGRGIDGQLLTTSDKAYRWLGTVAQLQNVYAAHPETINLQAVKISPSMAYSAK